MNDIEEKILELYIKEYKSEAASYRILGEMMNNVNVSERLRMFGIDKMYIYGGTYLAIQLYKASNNYVDVKGIVDKSRRLICKADIPVYDLKEFKDIYNGEKIIITPIFYYKTINEELQSFIDGENIIYIGELIEGIL